MAKLKKCTLYIKGMHCASCEILITDKFKEMPNVTVVRSSFKKQEAEVYFTGHLDRDAVNKKIQSFGYEIGDMGEKLGGGGYGLGGEESIWKKIIEAIFIAIGLGLIYLIFKELNLIY